MDKSTAFWVGIDLHQSDLMQAEAPVQAGYEASGCGYWLARRIRRWGADCEVVAPSLIPQRPGDRVKTDKRDALKLATLHRGDLLSFVRVPSVEEERVRRIVRTLDLHAEEREALSLLESELEVQLALLASADERIEQRSLEDPYAGPVSRLRCLRGIDTLSAMVLCTEVCDMKRFASASQFVGWLGLGVSEFTSVKRKQGRTTRTGNSRCRRILVEAAWNNTRHPHVSKILRARSAGQSPDVIAHAWRAQHRLHKTWRRLEPRVGSKKTVVAMARELAGFVWAIWLAAPDLLTARK